MYGIVNAAPHEQGKEADNKGNMKKRRFLFPLFFPVLYCLACKSPPPPPPGERPVAALWFDRIEAEGINRVVLYYRLRAGNPRPASLGLKIGGWKTVVDGSEYHHEDTILNIDEISAAESLVEIPGGGFVEKTLRLNLDLEESRESPEAGDSGSHRVDLLLNLIYQYDKEPPEGETITAGTVFPRIKRPEFTITEIAILQAELINTRFRVTVRIDNPNVFPVNLSSFGYELYGAGRFWADGREKDVLYIPARDSSEVKLFLLMNFINMKRELLDEVIAMRQVRYRFSGEALVGTGVSWLPEFRMRFDRSGRSDVLR
jgi:LEA14-like dessication related protein